MVLYFYYFVLHALQRDTAVHQVGGETLRSSGPGLHGGFAQGQTRGVALSVRNYLTSRVSVP